MGGEKRVLTKIKALKPTGKGGGGTDELREVIRGKDLFVLIKGAHGLKAADGPSDSSDPFCRMKIGEYVSFRTHTIFKTTQPDWNETKVVREADLINHALSGQPLVLEFGVYDYDVWKKHDKLGKAALDLSTLIEDFQAGNHAVRTLQLGKKLTRTPQGSFTSVSSGVSLSSSGISQTSDFSQTSSVLLSSGISQVDVPKLDLSNTGSSAKPASTVKSVWKILKGASSSGGSKESLGYLEVEVWMEDSTGPSEEPNPEGRVVQTVLRMPNATRGSSRSICIEVPDCGTLYEEPFVVYYKVTLFAALNLDYQAISTSCKYVGYNPSPKRDSNTPSSLRPTTSVDPPELAAEDTYDDESEGGNLDLLSMDSQPTTDNLGSGLYVWIKVVCKGRKYQTRLYPVPQSGNVVLNQSFVLADVRPVSKDPSVVFALYATTHKRTRGRNIANTDMPLSFMLTKVSKHSDFARSRGTPFPVPFDVDFTPAPGSSLISPMAAQLQLHAGVSDHDLRPQIYGVWDMLAGFDGQVDYVSKIQSQASLPVPTALNSVALPPHRSIQKFESLPDPNVSREAGQGLAITRSTASQMSRQNSESAPLLDAAIDSSRDLGRGLSSELDIAMGLRQRKITRQSGVNIDLDDVPDIPDDSHHQVTGTAGDSVSSSLMSAMSADVKLLSRQAKLRPDVQTRDLTAAANDFQPPTLWGWLLGLLQLIMVYAKDAVKTFQSGSSTPVHKPPTASGSISILIRSFEVLDTATNSLAFQTPVYHLVLKCGPHWWVTQPGRKVSGQIRWEVVLPVYDPASTLTVLMFETVESSLNKVLNQREKATSVVGRGRLRLPELPINMPSDVILDLRGANKGKVECTGTVNMRLHLKAAVTDLLQAYLRPSKTHAYYMLGLLSDSALVTKYWEDIRQRDLLERTPLTKKVMDAVLSTGRQKFTIQRIKAHSNRIKQLLKTEEVGKAASDFMRRVHSWEEPALTGGAVVGIVMLCKFTTLIVFLGVIGLIGWAIYMFMFDPPDPVRIDLELQTMNPTAEDMSGGKEDEESNEVPISNKYKQLKERYEFVMGMMLQVQNLIDDIATAIEKFSMLLTWQDPRATMLVVIALVIGLPIVWLLGLSNLLMIGMLWHIRPPSLRSPRPPPPVCLFAMLPAKADLRV